MRSGLAAWARRNAHRADAAKVLAAFARPADKPWPEARARGPGFE
jgi:hypothetical protein